MGIDYSQWGMIQGRSLYPCIEGGHLSERPVYFEHLGAANIPSDSENWIAGIKTSKWKLITRPNIPHGINELYDLEFNPQETNNLISEEPEIAKNLRIELDQIISWKKEILVETSEYMTEEEVAIVKKRLADLGYI